MAREGIPFLVICAAAGVFFALWGHPRVGVLFLLPLLFIAYFFRDPKRSAPSGDGLVVSPADGKVISIGQVGTSPAGAATKISVFLNIFDVHINRAPVPGRIERIDYRPGRFLAAWNNRASEENERNTFVIESPSGKVAFSQVAGLIARRIVCWKKEAEPVVIGEKVGMIMFGSRVDLYLPPEATPAVKVGDRVAGGESVIARMPR